MCSCGRITHLVRRVSLLVLFCLLLAGAELPGFAQYYIFRQDATIDANDPTYENLDIIVDRCTVTINGTHSFDSLTVQNSGVVTHSANPAVPLVLVIAYDAAITTGSRLDVSGKGYPAHTGAGRGSGAVTEIFAGGGGYGGNGGTGQNFGGGGTYGSITQPTDLGSGGGGGDGSSGGGAIHLVVGGTLSVNGVLASDGISSPNSITYSAGGSGGSIWITADTLNGNGLISANGGAASYNYNGGGGGGGRIALYAGTLSYTGGMQSYGSLGYNRGGAGTIYTKLSNQTYGNLLIANPGSGASTDLSGTLQLDNLQVMGYAVVSHPQGSADFIINVQQNCVIGQNAALSVSGRGFGSALGTGSGSGSTADTYTGGGGYGGNGGTGQNFGGGRTYGSITLPTDFGSGGGGGDGGNGGGFLRLIVGGTLTVNGVLASDGNTAPNTPNYSGGGSGGSLWVTAGTLNGNGLISANGGAASYNYNGGGGGGGRIALYMNVLSYTGGIQAYGGVGYNRGGAGTIYTKLPSQAYGDLLVANAGSGATTDLRGTLTFDNLRVMSNALVSHPQGNAGMTLNIITNLTIDNGAGLNATGRGYGARTGTGAGLGGINDTFTGGGGYGGTGGAGQNFAGGGTYGSFTQPVDLGSGAGGSDGGSGGGVIHLIVGGTLTVNGVLSSDGNTAPNRTTYSGGGSGGSVWVTAGILNGNGLISANGGAASYNSNGGGGGGGRIALYLRTNNFNAANVRVNGGNGRNDGGVGTIYYGTPVTISGTVTLQNCQNPVQPINFTLRAGSVSYTISRTLSSTGAYSLLVPPGSYTLAIKGRKWLQATAAANAASGSISNVNVTLKAGDATNDNLVDIQDLLLLIGAYNSNSASAQWNEAADLNCDGAVDITDLLLLIGNYNTAGAL